MQTERRRDVRHEVELPVTLARATQSAVTENVSYRGLLLRANMTIALGQLLRVAVVASIDAPIVLHGVPLWTSAGAFGEPSRVALHLIGRDERWERFIGTLQRASTARARAHEQR